jgi:Mg2+ and Co2+ transporter CorA
MNVQGIPFEGQHWGFWGAVGLSVMSSGAVILYLRLMGKP